MSMIVHYDGEGDPTVYEPSLTQYGNGPSVPDLAMAVDASIDAIGDALAEGDVGQAQALQTAADATSDALLDALGLPDADDQAGGEGGS